MVEPEQRLDEYNSDEWWDVCKSLRPEMTREEFDVLWKEFVDLKRMKQLN